MITLLFRYLAISLSLCLSACSIAPTSIVPHATSARATKPEPVAQNGSIFHASTFKSAFGDYRARGVGDVLTITINETVSANKSNKVADKYASSMNAQLNSLLGLNIKGMQASESAAINSSDQATGAANYVFTGSVAVTVIEVLPNGNLLVSGEKQIGMDKGAEFIRISGVVAPNTILIGNTIPSTQLADARVEYRTNSQMDPAELVKSIGRILSAALIL
ncbi:MAG: flagellar basal body L-ring protein FlgH [Methylococcales bacterium]